MNILIINHHAGGPIWGMEHRPYFLAREWTRLGHHVTIAAASFAHMRTVQPKLRGDTSDEVHDGIHWRFYKTPSYKGDGFDRMANVRAFLAALNADAAHLAQRPKPHVVIASSTYALDVKVARKIARASGAMLVHEVHDLMALSLVEVSGLSRMHPFVLWCSAGERAAYRDADVVISMLPKVHEHMRARGLDLIKLHVVPNGVSPEEWEGTPEPLRADVAAALARSRAQKLTIVGYAGAMGAGNALEVLIDAADILKDEPFVFLLVGDGAERDKLMRRAHKARLSNVVFLSPVPKEQIPALLRGLDIAYIGWRHQPIYRFGIAPSKLMDYMMAGCPVLASAHAGNDPVGDAECGLTVEAEDPVAVARGFRQLALAGADARAAMGRRGHAYVMSNHTYPLLAERYLDAVEMTRARLMERPVRGRIEPRV